ncbi:MAG: ribonuclease HII [Calditrichaeota bacterium]|nr:MAG: ribonuclease HII [Calditrichota bacterium]
MAHRREQIGVVDRGDERSAEDLEAIHRMLSLERELWRQGKRLVAGVDEAGRGPLAGPVVAAAVVYDGTPDIVGIDDSKQLDADTRERLYDLIRQEALAHAVGIAEVEEIDRLNILRASLLAMRRAIANLGIRPDHLLVDGRDCVTDEIPCTPVIKGDRLSYSVASASILAKVTRDRIMVEMDARFPEYGFASHKGYATPQHLDAIEAFGFCAIHRRSFHPKRFYDRQLSFFPQNG